MRAPFTHCIQTNSTRLTLFEQDHVTAAGQQTTTLLDLDTGARIPLSEAQDLLPSGLNPINLRIMERTSNSPNKQYVNSSPEAGV